MSKLNQEQLKRSIHEINVTRKQRKFKETIELQIGLKDYDPQKDKRFSGAIKLPFIPRTSMKAIILADQQHVDQAEKLGIPYIDAEGLKRFNKQRKPIKKFFKQYDILLASESILKQIPRLMGPALSKINKFPAPVTHNDNLQEKIDEAKATIKFALKKVLCMGVAVANVDLTEEQQRQNITLAINFLASLLKKNWNNIRTLHIKTSMGKPQRIYG